jgi:anti-sigma factor RsiW
MSASPEHRELTELIPSAALEILDPVELDRVLAHVETCAECRSRLADYREVVALLALRLPPREMDSRRSAGLRARLLVRARPESRSQALSLTNRWAGWLVAAGLAGVLLVHHSLPRPLAYGWLVAGLATMALVVLGAYARIQRARAGELRERLSRLEQKQKPR